MKRLRLATADEAVAAAEMLRKAGYSAKADGYRLVTNASIQLTNHIVTVVAFRLR